MRFLIIGLGSMSKRQIRNLQTLGQSQIIGFDLRKDRKKSSRKKIQNRNDRQFEEFRF